MTGNPKGVLPRSAGAEHELCKVVEVLVDAFIANGVTTVFGLMGDANMYWMARMGQVPGVQVIHARHENAAVAMADGYARSSGEVGVASVTSGPGITQIGTSLVVAARRGTPLVIFTGDTPRGSTFHHQAFDIEPFARSCGAGLESVESPLRAPDQVALAFFRARSEQRPIMLQVPTDVQDKYRPRNAPNVLPIEIVERPVIPHPDDIRVAADVIAEKGRPVFVGGTGALGPGAPEAILSLAERIGALLATTLPAKGLFDGQPFDLGICGGLSTSLTRRILAGSDCIIGVGAQMGHFTTDAGSLFPSATVIHIDENPKPFTDGRRVSHVAVRGDARLAVGALDVALDRRGVSATGYRTTEIADALSAGEPVQPPSELPPNTLDPAAIVDELAGSIPKDWTINVGSGHFWNFVIDGFSGRAANSYVFNYGFGAIGQGLPSAIGGAFGRPGRPSVLIDGDGSVLMNIQELETMGRYAVPLLIFIMNDGAYGAEVHKMRVHGFGDEAVFGFADFRALAIAFGVDGYRVDGLGAVGAIVREFEVRPRPMVVDLRISDTVMSRTYRRRLYGESVR